MSNKKKNDMELVSKKVKILAGIGAFIIFIGMPAVFTIFKRNTKPLQISPYNGKIISDGVTPYKLNQDNKEIKDTVLNLYENVFKNTGVEVFREDSNNKLKLTIYNDNDSSDIYLHQGYGLISEAFEKKVYDLNFKFEDKEYDIENGVPADYNPYGYYDEESNTVIIFKNPNIIEDKEDVLYKIIMILSNGGFSCNGFGMGINKGIAVKTITELYGDNKFSKTDKSMQYIVSSLQEIIDSRQLLDYFFKTNNQAFVESLIKVGVDNEIVFKFLNLCYMHSIESEENQNNPNYGQESRLETLKCLYTIEQAKIEDNIANGFYGSSSESVKKFVSHVQYILDVNQSTFALNEESQAILDKMRIEFEIEVYGMFSQTYGIESLLVLKDLHSDVNISNNTINYYSADSSLGLPITHREVPITDLDIENIWGPSISY